MTKKNPSALLGAGIALVVLLCCGGIVGVFGDDDKPTPTGARPSASAKRLVEPPVSIPAPTNTLSTVGPTPTPKKTTATPKRTSLPEPTPKRTTAKPKPTPKRTTASVQQGVHPGAFCSTQGARGVSKKGVPMVCTTTATDDRKRWRRA